MADTAISKSAEPVSASAMRRQMLKEFWFYFSENKGAVIGLYVFVALVILIPAGMDVSVSSYTLEI